MIKSQREQLSKLPRRWRAKIDARDCWRWTGYVRDNGYVVVKIQGKPTYAHRAIYSLLVGDVPDDAVIDHLCRVRHCLNPAHMEVVEHRENTMRGDGPTAENARKTHCLRGHPLSGGNLIERPHGWRECRTCRRANQRVYDRKRRRR